MKNLVAGTLVALCLSGRVCLTCSDFPFCARLNGLTLTPTKAAMNSLTRYILMAVVGAMP